MRGAPILIEEVEVDYPAERRSLRTILRGITLDIQGGEFVSIVGQTGCGKSTLLRLILGEERPTRGRVLVDGVVRTQPDRHCGYVPQRYSLFPHKTVLDNVTFGPEVTELGPVPLPFRHYRRRREEIREEALRYLRHTGLQGSDARKYPHQLSGGMQQRVAIARALTLDPEVLLMDEPFGALDAITREEMRQCLLDIWERTGKTVVLVTHSIDEAVFLSREVHVLGGRPARIIETISIGLPEPRTEACLTDPAFARAEARLRSLLIESHRTGKRA